MNDEACRTESSHAFTGLVIAAPLTSFPVHSSWYLLESKKSGVDILLEMIYHNICFFSLFHNVTQKVLPSPEKSWGPEVLLAGSQQNTIIFTSACRSQRFSNTACKIYWWSHRWTARPQDLMTREWEVVLILKVKEEQVTRMAAWESVMEI